MGSSLRCGFHDLCLQCRPWRGLCDVAASCDLCAASRPAGRLAGVRRLDKGQVPVKGSTCHS